MITSQYNLVALGICCLVGYGLGYGACRARSASFQNRGEARVRDELQANFDSPDYHLLNHITLKLSNGTTQIDHILVSRFGVFVIETKDYSGWIFANAKHSTWTQVLYGRKFKFQSPLFQNFRHTQAVQNLLDFLPADAFKSIVVFAGKAEFQTDKPTGVFTVPELIEYLRSCTQEIMSMNRVQFCVGRLETARLAISKQTDLEHVMHLERRHGRKD
jgi:hypothetical protein